MHKILYKIRYAFAIANSKYLTTATFHFKNASAFLPRDALPGRLPLSMYRDSAQDADCAAKGSQAPRSVHPGGGSCTGTETGRIRIYPLLLMRNFSPAEEKKTRPRMKKQFFIQGRVFAVITR